MRILDPFLRRQLMTGRILFFDDAGGDDGGKLMRSYYTSLGQVWVQAQNGLVLIATLDPLGFLSGYKSKIIITIFLALSPN